MCVCEWVCVYVCVFMCVYACVHNVMPLFDLYVKSRLCVRVRRFVFQTQILSKLCRCQFSVGCWVR